MARRAFVPPSGPNIPILYPKLEHDKEKIKKLFSTVAGLNIEETKNFVDENKLSWSVVDLSTGETLLHAVLDNELLSDTDKDVTKLTLMVNFLLHHGVNPSLANKHGVTPLHLAVSKQLTSIAKLLIASGVSLNVADSHLSSLLHYMAIGYRKKYEKPKIIGDLIPEEPVIKKIKPEQMKKFIAEIMKFLRSTNIKYYEFDGREECVIQDYVPLLICGKEDKTMEINVNSYFDMIMNYLQRYDTINKEEYENIIVKGYINKMTNFFSRTTFTNETEMKQKYTDIIDGLRADIEDKLVRKYANLISPKVDESLYEKEMMNLTRSNWHVTQNIAIDSIRQKIIEQDEKIYNIAKTACDTFGKEFDNVYRSMNSVRNEIWKYYSVLFDDFYFKKNPAGIVTPRQTIYNNRNYVYLEFPYGNQPTESVDALDIDGKMREHSDTRPADIHDEDVYEIPSFINRPGARVVQSRLNIDDNDYHSVNWWNFLPKRMKKKFKKKLLFEEKKNIKNIRGNFPIVLTKTILSRTNNKLPCVFNIENGPYPTLYDSELSDNIYNDIRKQQTRDYYGDEQFVYDQYQEIKNAIHLKYSDPMMN